MSHEITDSLPTSCIDQLVRLFSGAWWAPGRDRAGVERMLAGSTEVAAVVDPGGRLIGFARAITDGAYRALICDVMVVEAERGNDLGARLIAELLDRPTLRACARADLDCHESMVGYYERLGFGRTHPKIVRMSNPPHTGEPQVGPPASD